MSSLYGDLYEDLLPAPDKNKTENDDKSSFKEDIKKTISASVKTTTDMTDTEKMLKESVIKSMMKPIIQRQKFKVQKNPVISQAKVMTSAMVDAKTTTTSMNKQPVVGVSANIATTATTTLLPADPSINKESKVLFPFMIEHYFEHKPVFDEYNPRRPNDFELLKRNKHQPASITAKHSNNMNNDEKLSFNKDDHKAQHAVITEAHETEVVIVDPAMLTSISSGEEAFLLRQQLSKR